MNERCCSFCFLLVFCIIVRCEPFFFRVCFVFALHANFFVLFFVDLSLDDCFVDQRLMMLCSSLLPRFIS